MRKTGYTWEKYILEIEVWELLVISLGKYITWTTNALQRHLKVLLTNLPTNSPGVGEGARDASKNAKYNRLDQPREVWSVDLHPRSTVAAAATSTGLRSGYKLIANWLVAHLVKNMRTTPASGVWAAIPGLCLRPHWKGHRHQPVD